MNLFVNSLNLSGMVSNKSVSALVMNHVHVPLKTYSKTDNNGKTTLMAIISIDKDMPKMIDMTITENLAIGFMFLYIWFLLQLNITKKLIILQTVVFLQACENVFYKNWKTIYGMFCPRTLRKSAGFQKTQMHNNLEGLEICICE